MSAPCLLIISPGFPESEFDTSCLPHIQQFCKCLRTARPDLKIVLVALQYPFTPRTYMWNGIEVHATGGRNRAGFRRLITWLKASRTLKDLHRRYQPSAVLSLFLTESALLGKRFARRHGIRHLIWLQGQDALKANAYVARVRPGQHELAAISAENALELEKNHGIRPAQIIHNAVNTGIFPPLQTERDIDVLGVGALIQLKNFQAFIRVIHRVKKSFPGIRCCIAGEGPEQRELLELSQRLGLQANLKFLGRRPHDEILQLMNNTRVFLHTSTYEGLSTVLLEALYSGCRVVSTRPVHTEEVVNFTLCADEEQLSPALEIQLRASDLPRRILVHDMDSSARQALDFLLPK